MTTTDCFQGMANGNPSSKVLRPPGGGSSDIFGTGSAGHTSTTDAAAQNKSNKQQNNSSHIFGSPEAPEDQQGYKHINRKPQHSSQSAIFGENQAPSAHAADLKKKDKEEYWNAKPETKSKSEEFPAYDRSVYMDHMAPQRRNIQQVSTYNPITNESYSGYGDEPQQQQQQPPQDQKRRGQNPNTASGYNVITNELYENGTEPSPSKPVGKRVVTMSNSSDEGTYNPITGQTIGSKPEGQQRNSSKVLAPPGGKSSGLW